MALLYQLVRQGARNLTLLGISNGNDADLLAGAVVCSGLKPRQSLWRDSVSPQIFAGRWKAAS
jgi:hypothetical protein